MATYFLYRHIRLDLNVPFYIGIGLKNDKSKFEKNQYKRAFKTRQRNILWQRIVEKTEYSVEVIYESEKRSIICDKETEFINLYGRIDLKTGTLANLTDGGEGTFNMSPETLKRISDINRSKGVFKRAGEELRRRNLENPTRYWKDCKREDHSNSKRTFVYNPDGSFYKEFPSKIDAAEHFGMKAACNINNSMKRKGTCKGKQFFHEFKGFLIEPLYPYYLNTAKAICKIDPISNTIIKEFVSIKDACISEGFGKTRIFDYINKEKVFMGYIWRYKT